MRNRTNPIWTISKDEFIKLINTANSISEILASVGASVKGNGSWRAFRLRAKEESIDLTSFTERCKKNHKHVLSKVNKPIPIREVLVENSSYSRQELKRRLVSNDLLKYRCAICDNNGQWMGKKISLQLDHINGTSNDNRLDNLRFLCPNCHSQTGNFSGKARRINKEDLICITCGRPRSKSSKTGLCIKCSSSKNGKSSAHKNRVVNRPSKEKILDLLKTNSYTAVGRMYNVSDNAVRKWLK